MQLRAGCGLNAGLLAHLPQLLGGQATGLLDAIQVQPGWRKLGNLIM